MKSIVVTLLSTIIFVSCQNKKQEEVVIGKVPPKDTDQLNSSAHCYLFTNGKDSIRLTYIQENDEVEGWLNYDFFEKDGSIGEIEGKFIGDTLKLEYEFLSEGMYSEEEVYFLKKGGKLYRGAGEMRFTNDSTMVYSNPGRLNYNDTTPLSHLENCPENFIKPENINFYIKNSN